MTRFTDEKYLVYFFFSHLLPVVTLTTSAVRRREIYGRLVQKAPTSFSLPDKLWQFLLLWRTVQIPTLLTPDVVKYPWYLEATLELTCWLSAARSVVVQVSESSDGAWRGVCFPRSPVLSQSAPPLHPAVPSFARGQHRLTPNITGHVLPHPSPS